MKNKSFMLGVAVGLSQLDDAGIELIRAAGIRWLRCGNFGFDAEKFLNGKVQGSAFHEVKERIAGLRTEGFEFMGITPGPREMTPSAGKPGSPAYMENYGRICAFFGSEFKGLIDTWQIANELDIWIFRDTLSMDQSVKFLKAGIRGLKSAGKELKAGINITLFPSLPGEVDGNTEAHEGIYLAKKIYGDHELELDYAGFDSYPGTWRKGGAESWDSYLDEFHRLTKKPVIIQEFGYSAEGDLMNAEDIEKGLYPCQCKKWKFSWKGAHTPEIQSDFIEESFKVFAAKPFVIGATYYRWKDSEKCWQCGQPDCPAETAWGLLDAGGNPRVSYEGFKRSAARYFCIPQE